MSFAAPTDAFFPFGANLLGAGKFLARGEASPYAQNMAGRWFHNAGFGERTFQTELWPAFPMQTARDLIFFPYRLNGQITGACSNLPITVGAIGLFDAE